MPFIFISFYYFSSISPRRIAATATQAADYSAISGGHAAIACILVFMPQLRSPAAAPSHGACRHFYARAR